jgi:hypothetical protein
MKIMQFANTKVGMVVALSAIAGLAVYVAGKQVVETVGDVGNAINPINNDNVFAVGVDSVGAKLTGNADFKLGVWVYDKFNDEYDPSEPIRNDGVWAGVPTR